MCVCEDGEESGRQCVQRLNGLWGLFLLSLLSVHHRLHSPRVATCCYLLLQCARGFFFLFLFLLNFQQPLRVCTIQDSLSILPPLPQRQILHCCLLSGAILWCKWEILIFLVQFVHPDLGFGSFLTSLLLLPMAAKFFLAW